jgi:hypothetical protein
MRHAAQTTFSKQSTSLTTDKASRSSNKLSSKSATKVLKPKPAPEPETDDPHTLSAIPEGDENGQDDTHALSNESTEAPLVQAVCIPKHKREALGEKARREEDDAKARHTEMGTSKASKTRHADIEAEPQKQKKKRGMADKDAVDAEPPKRKRKQKQVALDGELPRDDEQEYDANPPKRKKKRAAEREEVLPFDEVNEDASRPKAAQKRKGDMLDIHEATHKRAKKAETASRYVFTLFAFSFVALTSRRRDKENRVESRQAREASCAVSVRVCSSFACWRRSAVMLTPLPSPYPLQ